MNKRIQELAEQTGLAQAADVRDGYLYPAGMEKFAKLLIQEVLAVQEKLIAEGHNAWHLNGPTKKYFGVE